MTKQPRDKYTPLKCTRPPYKHKSRAFFLLLSICSKTFFFVGISIAHSFLVYVICVCRHRNPSSSSSSSSHTHNHYTPTTAVLHQKTIFRRPSHDEYCAQQRAFVVSGRQTLFFSIEHIYSVRPYAGLCLQFLHIARNDIRMYSDTMLKK